MKRIISTLLSLSLVLSLLPAVALAEGESLGLLFEAPDSLTVGESASAIVGVCYARYSSHRQRSLWANPLVRLLGMKTDM